MKKLNLIFIPLLFLAAFFSFNYAYAQDEKTINGVIKNDFENRILYNEYDFVKTINAAEYGVNGEDLKDDTLALKNAVTEAAKYIEEGLVKIKLPTGGLDFIEGMNPGNVKYAVDFSNLNNLYLEGDNTTIYLHGDINGIYLNNSGNIYIKNINFEWGQAPYLCGMSNGYEISLFKGYEYTEKPVKKFLPSIIILLCLCLS